MKQLFSESWNLYKSKFKTILLIMLPVFILGLGLIGYLEDKVVYNFPPSLGEIIPILFCILVLAAVIITSQLALFSFIKNGQEKKGIAELYKSAWKEFVSFSWIKKLITEIKKAAAGQRSLVIKRVLVIFIIWFACNGLTAQIVKERLEMDLILEQAAFGLLNFIFLFPFIHIFLFLLYQGLIKNRNAQINV